MKTFFASILLLVLHTSYAQNEIPIEIGDGGYLFVNVVINDNVTARFMLDTGAGVNMVSTELFEKIKNTIQPIGLHTGVRHNGEKITGELYKIPSLSVGSFKKTNVVIGQFEMRNCDGLLSMDFFRDVPFTIDFINKKMIIESSESLKIIKTKAETIPIHLKTNGPYELDFFVNICINDSLHAEAEFDTGSGFNMLMLHPKYLKLLNIAVPQKKTQDLDYYIYSTTIAKLKYCGLSAPEQQNHFVGFKEGLIYDALIGSGMFQKNKLTVDIPGSKMFVSQ